MICLIDSTRDLLITLKQIFYYNTRIFSEHEKDFFEKNE